MKSLTFVLITAVALLGAASGVAHAADKQPRENKAKPAPIDLTVRSDTTSSINPSATTRLCSRERSFRDATGTVTGVGEAESVALALMFRTDSESRFQKPSGKQGFPSPNHRRWVRAHQRNSGRTLRGCGPPTTPKRLQPNEIREM